jgi:tetratricopeptide (TPR) repeat protein
MARHYAQLCSESAAAFTGDRQRVWLTAIDQEHDNLRAALDWAVANDDADTALMIAGGASWPHWLRGTVIEGKRWLDDAFACGGEADERTKALALTGRGLIDFLAGSPEHSDEDLEAAIEIFQRHDDVDSLRLAYSFWAEQPAALGDIAEARRRRLQVLDFLAAQPQDEFDVASQSYSRAKLALLYGDLDAAERHYRAATAGFARFDRPVMNSMCLGMVADFDERAGDYPAAIKALEAAIETNQTLLGGFTGSLLARLAWVLLQDGQTTRAEAVYQQALASGRRVQHTMVVFLALTGVAALDRMNGRNGAAELAATEALEIYRTGGPRRFRNRVDTAGDLQIAAAVCCVVLAAVAAERDDPEQAATLLAEAERLRAEARGGVPWFQQDDVDRVRDAIPSS